MAEGIRLATIGSADEWARPVRILTLNYEYPPIGGGGGVVHALLADQLARRHDVTVVTSAFRDLPSREVIGGVEILRVPILGRTRASVATRTSMLLYPPSAGLVTWRHLRGRAFDIVHGHFAIPTGPGSLAVAMGVGRPHVLSLHGGDLYDPSKGLSPHRFAPFRIAVDAVLKRSHAVVAQSKNTRDNVYRFYRYRGPVDVIPLGIRFPSINPKSRNELNLPEGVFIIITVGRLIPRKSIETAIRLLNRPECGDVHLLVVGTGPLSLPLRRAAEESGVGSRVHFSGRVDEELKWQLLFSADAYLSTSMHEGFGLTFIEAMFAGLPVICYDHGGQTDFLENGVTGFVVPAGDEGRLGSALTHLRGNPALCRRTGEGNRRRARRFSIESCAEKYEALFEHTLSGSLDRSAIKTRARRGQPAC